jgi:hypothetical protein
MGRPSVRLAARPCGQMGGAPTVAVSFLWGLSNFKVDSEAQSSALKSMVVNLHPQRNGRFLELSLYRAALA